MTTTTEYRDLKDAAWQQLNISPGDQLEATIVTAPHLRVGDIIVCRTDHDGEPIETPAELDIVRDTREVADVKDWNMLQIASGSFTNWGQPVHAHQHFLILRKTNPKE